MLNKEALEYLVKLGYQEETLVETDQGLFSKTPLTRVKYPTAKTLIVSNLTSIVDFIKANIDQYEGRLLVQVVNHKEISVLTPLSLDRDREEIIRAVAILPDNIRYDNFIGTEQFNIMLQSGFAENEHKKLLLKFTGLIKDEAVKSTGDDGISQKITIKTGVASVGEAQVPNPVTLAPFRTFLELEQPESKFIFRMQEGPRAALYEADGGAWKNEAMRRIKEYLEKNLSNKLLQQVNIIS